MKNVLKYVMAFILSWGLLLLIFLINEVILRKAIGMDSLYVKPSQLLPYIALAAGLALLKTRKSLIWSLVIIAALQLIWFGAYSYFGNVLTPDVIILGFSQLFEIGIAAQSEWQIFILPIALVVGLNAVLAFVLFKTRKHNSEKLARLGVVLIILPFVVVSARAFLHSRPFVLNPSPYLPSHTGTVQSFSLAIRNIIKDSQLSDGGAAKLVVGNKIDGALSEPITVAVIMGESIAPLQLGIFGEEGTTPRMAKRLGSKGELTYFPKIGISAGVSTLGSVPLYIRMAHNPVAAFRRKNTIFEIAKQSDFTVGYYSAQNIKPLQIGGGLSFIDQLETRENWVEVYDQKQDGVILDQIAKSPINGNRRFMFIHQRTNHSPYFCDEKTSQDFGQQKRVARYRNGLLCYDRSLDELLTYLQKQPGALYVFIAADHNELMGTNGKWGHSHLHVQTALVPMILATNRPNSDVAKAFAELKMPSAFEFMRLVARALGRKTSLDRPSNKIFINGVIAYGRRGYLEIEKTADVSRYKQTLVDPASSFRRTRDVSVTGLVKGLEFMKKYDPASQ